MDDFAEDHVMSAVLALLPVMTFLAALVALDSYKLVRLRTVLGVVACGMAAGALCYWLNGLALGALPIEFRTYTRYVAPLVEELVKALVLVALIRTHRVGFLVDAAICGFAVGTGFALIENLQYLFRLAPDSSLGLWIVRGFGTALMHGGASAIFAVSSVAMLEKAGGWRAFVPGFALAVVLHSAFNHFFSPLVSTLAVAAALPLLLYAVFARSERALGEWLGKGFDADAEMLALINSGNLSDSPLGRYLHTLRDRFRGPVLADLLCYLRVHTELALRAKGILLMRESGFDVPVDDATREKFAELEYLEDSVGKTGLIALRPLLHMSHKDLWQLYMLGK
jgi:RsiW-degrading membrane proteinase PrsW (M82 family)